MTALERDPKRAKRLSAVRDTLSLLQIDPHHPKLDTHEFQSLKGARGEKVFASAVETKGDAAAHRVFWHYGPMTSHIIVLAITEYP